MKGLFDDPPQMVIKLFWGVVVHYKVIFKPRGQLRGRGGNQIITLLHKPYLVKVSNEGEGVKNVVYGWPLRRLHDRGMIGEKMGPML